MKNIPNGVELSNGAVIYFDSGNLYIGLGKMPIIIKSVSPNMVSEIGDFFQYYGETPDDAADRIYFKEIHFRIDGNVIYAISKNVSLELFPISLSELRKLGTFFRKKSKEILNQRA